MFTVPILAVRKNTFAKEGGAESVYYTLTVLLDEEGNTTKVSSSKPAKVGQKAVLSIYEDRKRGGLGVRCTDVIA